MLHKTIEWLIFGLLIVVAMVIASPLLPTKGWVSFYVVVSGSMEPKIHTGSLVLTTPASELSVGSIIAFRSPVDSKEIILHRIANIDSSHGTTIYATKGDANPTKDAWIVTPDQIKGKYQFGIPYIGYPIGWAKTPLGFSLIIGIPALIIVFLQIRKILKGINEEVAKRTEKAIQEQNGGQQKEAEANRHHPTIRSLTMLLLAASLSSGAIKPAQALFSDKASIQGLSFQMEPILAGHCPVNALSPDMFNHPPFSNHGVTSYRDSWVNDIFDWDAFWQRVRGKAPKACTIPVAPSPFDANIKPNPTPTITPTPSATPLAIASTSAVAR